MTAIKVRRAGQKGGLVMIKHIIAVIVFAVIGPFSVSAYESEFDQSDVIDRSVLLAVNESVSHASEVISPNPLISLNGEKASKGITFLALPLRGVAPQLVFFHVEADPSTQVLKYQMDFEGDGSIDYTETAFESVSHTYNAEGEYSPTVTVTDSEGNIYTDSITIVIISIEELDAHLRSIWNAMRAALARGDYEEAVRDIDHSMRDIYLDNFRLMVQETPEQIPELVEDLADIKFIELSTGRFPGVASVEYDIRFVAEGRELSHMLQFIKGLDGIWKIRFF